MSTHPESSQVFQIQADVELHVVQHGRPTPDRPTLIFLHYWGGSANTWSHLLNLLSPSHPALALDFRGWGSSKGPADPAAYTITHLATDVETLLQTHYSHLEKFILVGLSMGAKVAQAIAGRGHLDRQLAALILLSPAPLTPLELPPPAREQQIHAYDNWTNAKFVARNVLLADPEKLPVALLKQTIGDMLRGNEYARAAWPAYAMREDLGDFSKKINVPVLVVAAALDVVEPLQRVQKEICARIHGARLRVVEGSGHLSPLEKAGDVAGHILEFLRTL